MYSYCLNLVLPRNILFSPSMVNEILAGYSNLGWHPWCFSDCRNLSPRFRILELPDHHHPLDSGAADSTSEMMSPTANQKASGLFQKLSKESSDWLSWQPGAMKDIWCDILHRESLSLMSMIQDCWDIGAQPPSLWPSKAL